MLNSQVVRINRQILSDSWNMRIPVEKAVEMVRKVSSIYNRYVDNIYNMHKLNRLSCSAKKSQEVWFYAFHTNKEYMNI